MTGMDGEFPEIAATVRLYVEGMVEADEGKMRAAFHPRACCVGHFEGGLEWDGLDAFIAAVRAAVTEPQSDPYFRILSIGVQGDTACVLVEDDWLGMRFTDTLGLLREGGRWVIVSKLFWHHPAP